MWSVCHRVNSESSCILSAKGKCEPSHLRILHSSRVRCLLYFPHFLLLSSWNQNFKWLTLAQICFSCRDSIVSSCFFTWKPLEALDDTTTLSRCWQMKLEKNSPLCVWKLRNSKFFPVLSTFQMFSNMVDFRDGLLFSWIGNQASFSLECKNNSWNNCWGRFNCSVNEAFSLRLPSPLFVVVSAFCCLRKSYQFWLFLIKEG